VRKRAAPKHLSADSRRVWRRVADDFDLWQEDAALLTLTAAMEARDRCEQAREQLATEGLTVATGAGGLKPHPAAGIERDNRLAMVRCLRELSLDGGDAGYESARPPRVGSGRS
jgi:P27 family predicted phage terminase small subunit